MGIVESIRCAYVSCVCHRKSVGFRIHARNLPVRTHRMHCHWWDVDLCPYLSRANRSAGNYRWCYPLFSDRICGESLKRSFHAGKMHLESLEFTWTKMLDTWILLFWCIPSHIRQPNGRSANREQLIWKSVCHRSPGRSILRKVIGSNFDLDFEKMEKVHLRAFALCRLCGSMIGGAWHICGSSDIA